MSLAILASVRALVAAGATPEIILAVVEAAVSTEAGALSRRRASDAARQAAKRDRERNENHVTSRDVTVTVCDTPSLEVSEGFSPTPPFPNLPKPSPLSPPKGGSCPPKNRNPKNSRIDYPGPFQILWDTFPHHPNSSKAEAYRSWQHLDGMDQNACLDGAMAYRRWLKAEGERRPRDPPIPCHLVTYLNQRRWEALLEATS